MHIWGEYEQDNIGITYLCRHLYTIYYSYGYSNQRNDILWARSTSVYIWKCSLQIEREECSVLTAIEALRDALAIGVGMNFKVGVLPL